MVIVGAGEAGVAAALRLREAGYNGTLTLLGDEHHRPYERPPLSKAVLVEQDVALPLNTSAERFDPLNIDYRPGVRVEKIDPARQSVRAGGADISYDALLLATGAQPRRLTLPGHEHVHYLRRFEDALILRANLKAGRHVIIIGGGFIGLECAASARKLGCEVSLVEAAQRILMRGVPEQLAQFIEARHRAEGVRFYIGTALEKIEPTAVGLTLVLADGTEIAADYILAGVGAVPETALAQAAGVQCQNGIVVDAQLRTSAPAIFAAGDCCSFPHPLYDNRIIRLEAWRNAQNQGRCAANSILGEAADFAAVPWFWSDQYDLHLQIAGLAEGADQAVTRDLGEDARMMFHVSEDGRLLSAAGVGPIGKIAKEIRLAEMMIARGSKPASSALADPAVKLKSLL
jgi:3-phenylpropionate/trans-cinnamate dioxygenase ferredoxin reductase component